MAPPARQVPVRGTSISIMKQSSPMPVVDGQRQRHGGGGVMQKPSIYRNTSFSNPMHPIYKTSELTIAGQKPRRGMPMIMATT